MQDVQNIPNPDVNSVEENEDFGNHSELEQNGQNPDVEQPTEDIPVPLDSRPSAPVEEPPESEEPPIKDDNTDTTKRIL
ncbi:MAG TPA: hypothetical protein PKY59_23605 [Pyrinomonadaceae bacterium]|nr:hypothetical protein [Pyrinomonadaceae bacterium]